ncbi:MAG: DUF4011 domain-containing protein [Bacteroidaceae bacterium]|nr:DUF4011 domain-containing protein [Bacteroidaceae bacterium]
MEKEIIIKGAFEGKITMEYQPCVNYAMMLNNCDGFTSFRIQNNQNTGAWENVTIAVSGDMIKPSEVTVKRVLPNDVVAIDQLMLMPDSNKLMALTESVQTSFLLTVTIGETRVLRDSYPLRLMAFDQWQGNASRPEIIASFVTPNHPAIPAIILKASNYLEMATGKNAMDQYFSGDRSYVEAQVESIYKALLDLNLTYVVNPPRYEDEGQRVRLTDKVLGDKLGTCLDLTLLLCSCFEYAGLRSAVVFYEGHTVAGVWMEDETYSEMVDTDCDKLKDWVFDDYAPLVLLESTALTNGQDYEKSKSLARDYLEQNHSDYERLVDIYQARCIKIRPLPHTILSKDGWEIKEMPDYDALFAKLTQRNPYDIHGLATNDKLQGKQRLWERKLLDLTLRNSLLNMKSGKRIIPLKDLSIDDVLSHLVSENLIHDIDEGKDGFATVKELYRAAKNSIEENGANTLFLSVGTMRWYEEGGSRPYFAPVMFLPLEMVRHSSTKYIIRLRDDEALMNITLMEMMRQSFGIEPPVFSQEEMSFDDGDESAFRWKEIFAKLQQSIAEINHQRKTPDAQWEIVEECMIGIFSFSKFVMWHDIHSNPHVLENQPLLRSLIEGRMLLADDAEDTDARQLDHDMQPSDCAIPLSVDSSQLEAIVSSGKGKSFILHGPPGTGKSQTITNMIANALYHNKRVLFVAEKKAALEVVQSRLESIGLAPYCLELHSNKVDKKHFLRQMEDALTMEQPQKIADYEKRSKELYAERMELNSYVEAMHKERKNSLSLYQYINRCVEIEGEMLNLPYAEICNLTIPQIEDICALCRDLDTVQQILGTHPSKHPLLGLYPLENTADNQKEVTAALNTIPALCQRSEEKEQKWWNRWFFKRTSMQILQRSGEWKAFSEVATVDPEIMNSTGSLLSAAKQWNANTDRLRLWYHYSIRAQKLMDYGIPELLEFYLNGNTGESLVNAFLKGYYHRMAMNVLDNESTLRSFNGMLFENIINSYRKMTDDFQRLTVEELRYRLYCNLPQNRNVVDRTIAEELAILNKRVKNRGRGTSVRRIINQTRHIIPQLCPCMLMSPLSVAQYLEMANSQFDLVIFDEASQMPTSEAVGAIARGKAVVVVGDAKQMPPTSFFQSQNTSDDDVTIDDLDSILDDCISLSMPSRYLSWHYRSRHESLIAFSNTNFYDGRLITFPSVDDQDRRVSLQHVDGIYDFGKSRSNKLEAKAIVDEVIARLESQPERSIGIVAFSKVQASLIDDMLSDALAKRPELEKIAFGAGTSDNDSDSKADSHESREPLFVKNLENVQGDERDVILFSVGYGPDKNGRVSMNFGPLNQQGGERRLNVAVSRARYEMKVFSSLHAHQIDLQRTNALGVAGLKNFLAYAESGILPTPMSQLSEETPDPQIMKIAKQLRAEGKEVDVNVGRSKFKIDIAVVDSENPSRYTTAYISDGTRYYATPTARDREIVQPAVLKSLGWNVERIWTPDMEGANK